MDEKASESQMRLDAEAFKARLAAKALTIVVYGASGDLAKKKTYPALFDLFCEQVFPPGTKFVGAARSGLNPRVNNDPKNPSPGDDTFKPKVTFKLPQDQEAKVAQFYEQNQYFKLEGYNDEGSYQALGDYLNDLDAKSGRQGGNRLFYFALPPTVYADVANFTSRHCFSANGWNRVIIEKPFGKDLDSAIELLRSIGSFLDESVVYRIDHYLAKEMAQNIMTLRFGNTIWDYLWDRKAISNVKISFKENITAAGREGYYDDFGAIRDIFQNHLMQVFTLVAMEAPVSLHAKDVRDEKVKVLKAVRAPTMDRVVVGQYNGYRNPDVNPESNQVTFFQTVLFINNGRWQGVPFICKCGKALDERKAEVRIQFKSDGLHLFPGVQPNELVIRLQPNEAMYLKINTKVPGFAPFSEANLTELDISYNERFANLRLPDAYTRLIADCLRGDQALFVREDELLESWRIVTPILQALEERNEQPPLYEVGSRGPAEADEMAQAFGFLRDTDYQWPRRAVPPTKL